MAKPQAKDDQRRIEVAGAWNGVNGYRLMLDKRVRGIVMEDGTVLRPGDFYFDLYCERLPEPSQGPAMDRRMQWARSHAEPARRPWGKR